MENIKANAEKKQEIIRYCQSHIAFPLKSLPPKKKVWLSSTKSASVIAKIKEEALLSQVLYTDASISGHLKCGLNFFHIIASVCRKFPLNINIPETLIYGHGFETPTFIYTDTNGILKYKSRINSLQLETIQEIFEYHRCKIKKTYTMPLAIVKCQNSLYDRILMKGSELKNEIKNGLKSDFIFQRYIFPRGNKACKLRVIWQEGIETKFYTITNKQRLDGKNESITKTATKEYNGQEANVFPSSNDIKASIAFGQTRDTYSRKVNLNRSESEILSLGQKYLNERSLAGKLIELDDCEHTDHLLNTDNKEAGENNRSNTVKTIEKDPIVKTVSKVQNEFQKYLEESITNVNFQFKYLDNESII